MALATVHAKGSNKHGSKKGKGEHQVAHSFAGRLLGDSSQSIPKYELCEDGMDAKAALQAVLDECMLDGKPDLNLASFVGTWMEEEANELLLKTCNKNISDQLQYPACREIEERCVNIISNLFNGTGSAAPPEENDKQKQEGQNPSSDSTGPSGGQADQNAGSVGTSTVGSSEAVMLGALAMKWRWRQWRAKQAEKREKAAKGQPSDKPAHTDTAKDKDQHKQNKAPNPGAEEPEGQSKTVLKAEGWATSEVMHGREYGPGSGEPPCNMIVNAASHVSVLKACKYLDIQPRVIPLGAGRHVMDPALVAKQLDVNTIGIICVLGTTLTGELDPVEEIHEVVSAFNKKHGTEVSIHIDAASGGFTVPFTHGDKVVWDFRLEWVKSINVSGHKFGLVYAGVGWVLFRERKDLPADLVFHVNYLGADEPTYGLNFSRSAAPILLQYYQFLRLGFTGYGRIQNVCMDNAKRLAEQLQSMHVFEIVSANLKPGAPTIPIVVARFKPDKEMQRLLGFDETELVRQLQTKGWIIPAYTLPKDCEDVQVMRIVVRESMSSETVDLLLNDIKHAVATLMTRHADVMKRARAEVREQMRKMQKGSGKTETNSNSSSADGGEDAKDDDPDADARNALRDTVLSSMHTERPHRFKNLQKHTSPSPDKGEQDGSGKSAPNCKPQKAGSDSASSAASSSSSISSTHSSAQNHGTKKRHHEKKQFSTVPC